MSRDLIPSNDEVKAIEIMAKNAVESKYVEKLGGYAGVFSIAMYAREIGVPVMTALFGGMSNILGKITISPSLMNAMIRKAGHKLEIDSNDSRCTIKGTRKDTGEVCTVTFSVEDARRAGVYKAGGGWDKYPSDMCFARALSRLARRLFPDVIGMSYAEGEIDDTPKASSSKIEELETVDVDGGIGTEELNLRVQCREQFKSLSKNGITIDDFIDHVNESTKKGVISILKSALQNPEGFKKAFLHYLDTHAHDDAVVVQEKMAL